MGQKFKRFPNQGEGHVHLVRQLLDLLRDGHRAEV